jgi:hypothetical protein
MDLISGDIEGWILSFSDIHALQKEPVSSIRWGILSL